MNIVFNINPLALEGLGATLTSLVRNCIDNEQLQLFFLCADLTNRDKQNISLLLKMEGYKGGVTFIDFDAKKTFGHLNSLHGDWTAYGRLLIADHVPYDTALYLDSDLLILLDVSTFNDIDLGETYLAAESGTKLEWALDGKFLINKLNRPPDQLYFNSGIVLFNLKKWREDNLNEKWKMLANEFPFELVSHDQTLLNAICEGNFTRLLNRYNNAWFAGMKTPAFTENTIMHFVGSPKPWDLLGKFIHEGYHTWSTFNTPFWKSTYGKISRGKLKRGWQIKKSLLKNLWRKCKRGVAKN